MNIGNEIKRLRGSLQITQEKLAADMGVSDGAVSKWENGNSLPDIVMLCALADYFGVTTDVLLGREKAAEFLICDDAEFVREVLKKLLDKKGCKCIGEAKTGAQLLEQLAVVQPSGVFLDIGLPDKNGLELLDSIKEKYPAVEVVMLTAQDKEEVRRQAIKSGAAAYITKPFLPEHIYTVLKDVFRL